jgi:hypothetical protein
VLEVVAGLRGESEDIHQLASTIYNNTEKLFFAD